MPVPDRIRIIPHAPAGIPDCGSFEVRYPDGRDPTYFFWDDNPGRRSITLKVDQEQAKKAAQDLARAEQQKVDKSQ
ncbi:hypothetical protein [Bradyrhizobium sp. AUGA SZCCT0160]|uniref:hypothetical protein n=1 Tax=Bradyrhizobium sp. AUGA SZCCT0160 TaxID=2807662 RepID=UPI001BA86FED|nr:hypothetical protein [Bradyrhizobium sp. AUGA SZCCT0160]MBR1193264.1 hypothetical protein [Bradyrhizobium sp. AUGA SZCCT0160]